ncbi:retinol-binding protein pinta-like [Culicoides brevitarsis]|uniref:retinol-binding protein pinta-like n=1 Tax=Culicoides brevitarsis TaxID=469753 RepID=UPI00307CC3F3
MALKVRDLPPELTQVAFNDFGETPEKLTSSIIEIRKWLEANPHIKPRTDDQFFATFLRGCKYDMKIVKEKLESFYTVRTQLPEFFIDRNTKDQKLNDLLKAGIILPLPKTSTPDAPRTVVIRFTSYDPSKYKMAEVVTLIGLVFDILSVEDDNSAVSGQIYILDLAGASFKHVFQFTPSLLKKFATLGQGGNPIRVKEQHFINTPTGFGTIFNIFKGLFAKEDLLMQVHSKVESLHKFVPPSILPVEYGGGDYKCSDIINTWSQKFLDFYDYFMEDKNFGVDLEMKKHLNKGK